MNARIPDEVIELVLKNYDISDVVGKYVHLAKSGHYMKGLCPFHSEKTPSFTVTPEKQIYYCYGCHAGGNAIHFLMQMEGYTFPEAVRAMAEEAHIPISWEEQPTEEETKEQQEISALLKGHEFAAKFYHHVLKNTTHGKKAMSYLKDRGFTDKMIDTFQLGYAPPMWDTLTQFLSKREFLLPLMEKGGLVSKKKSEESAYVDRFRDRVIFPIFDTRGRVIAFAGRILGDDQPKYLNSPETPLFNKSRTLYPIHEAKGSIRKKQQVILFEGYIDVIKAWDGGVTNGVATMGTSLTDQHALMLRRYAEEAIICYDGDDAGQNAAYKILPILESAGCRVKVAMLPNKMDPDEYISSHDFERFNQEILQSAVAANKYRLIYMRRNFQLQHEAERLRYIRSSLQIIAGMSSPTEREHYIRDLSKEFQYSLDTLKQEMFEIRQQMQKKPRQGDNKDNWWNNVMNNGEKVELKPLFPAYHNAERKLLAIMIQNKEIAADVEKRLADQFNVEVHAVLAAYLYAYFAQGNDANPSRYIASLHDEKLARLASELLLSNTDEEWNYQVIDDYIREIHKFPKQLDIKRKKDEMIRAERSGDVTRAAQIASEIITLDKELKSLKEDS